MNFNSIIQHEYDPIKKTPLLTWDKEPYLRAKVLRIWDAKKADEYYSEQKPYPFIRVEGYNIFVIFAGYQDEPGYTVPTDEVQRMLEVMANWYLENIVPTFSPPKRKKLLIKKQAA